MGGPLAAPSPFSRSAVVRKARRVGRLNRSWRQQHFLRGEMIQQRRTEFPTPPPHTPSVLGAPKVNLTGWEQTPGQVQKPTGRSLSGGSFPASCVKKLVSRSLTYRDQPGPITQAERWCRHGEEDQIYRLQRNKVVAGQDCCRRKIGLLPVSAAVQSLTF